MRTLTYKHFVNLKTKSSEYVRDDKINLILNLQFTKIKPNKHCQLKGLKRKQKYWSYHVWLRGSQFSLPTFSMQNFCGPLLPVFIRHQAIKKYKRYHCISQEKYSMCHLIVAYPSNQRSPPQEDDRFPWQTAGVSFFFHCPFLSQTANRTSALLAVKHYPMLWWFPF